jgi:hypothetical protein
MQLGLAVEPDPISFSLVGKAIGSSNTNQTHALGLAAKLDLNAIGSGNGAIPKRYRVWLRARPNNKKY